MKPLTRIFYSVKYPWQSLRIEDLRISMMDPAQAYEDANGIRHWHANGAIIPPHVYKDASLVCPPEQVAAYDAYTQVIMDGYKLSMSRHPRKPSAEESFEMSAAFGPGVVVENILTGARRTTR